MSNFNEFEYADKIYLRNTHFEVKPLSEDGFKKYISDKSYVYHYLNKPNYERKIERKPKELELIKAQNIDDVNKNDDPKEENTVININQLDIGQRAKNLKLTNNIKNNIPKHSAAVLGTNKLNNSKSSFNINSEHRNRVRSMIRQSENPDLFEDLGNKIKEVNRSLFTNQLNASRLLNKVSRESSLINTDRVRKSGSMSKMTNSPSINIVNPPKITNLANFKTNALSNKRLSNSVMSIRNSTFNSPNPNPIYRISQKQIDPLTQEKIAFENTKLRNILLEQTDSKFLGTAHLPKIAKISDHPIISKNKLDFSKYFGQKYNLNAYFDLKKDRAHRNFYGALFEH
jgi:hypothetical protein